MTHLQGNERVPTHVCLDCGALGYAGGYHDHGNGNAGDTIALKDLPEAIRAMQQIENERDELRERLARLMPAPCCGICGGGHYTTEHDV